MKRILCLLLVGASLSVACDAQSVFRGNSRGKRGTKYNPIPTLVSVTVSPTSASKTAGQTQDYSATKHMSDGSTADVTGSCTWTSTNTSVATVSSNTATAVAQGVTNIRCTYSAVVGQAALEVTPPTVVSIAVSPSSATVEAPNTQQFTATCTMSDASTPNCTDLCTWSSTNTLAATVASGGLATGVGAGSTNIKCDYDSKSAQGSLTVTVPPTVLSIAVNPSTSTLEPGQTQTYNAIATMSDATTRDVTSLCAWVSTSPSVATISGSTVTAVADGTTTIRCTYTVQGNASLTVETPPPPVTLSSIAVSPEAASIETGQAQSYSATGTMSDSSNVDLTSLCTWTSGTPAVATISSNIATGVTAGTSAIRCTYLGLYDEHTLTVTDPAPPPPPPSSCTPGSTVGRTLVNSCTTLGTGKYYLGGDLNCPGTALATTGANVDIDLQCHTITYGTTASNFTVTNSSGTSITVGTVPYNILPRPTSEAKDGQMATLTDISNTITCSDGTKTRGTHYEIGIDRKHGKIDNTSANNRALLWLTKPAQNVTCTIPSYTYTFPRFGILNSNSNQYVRATGNTTSGGAGLIVSNGTITAHANAPAYNAPIFNAGQANAIIRNVTLNCRGWSGSAIRLSYSPGFQFINSTIKCDPANTDVFWRDYYDGYAGWNQNRNVGTAPGLIDGIAVTDTSIGGLVLGQENSELKNSSCTGHSKYTNDFCFNGRASGSKVHDVVANCYDANDASVSCRGALGAANFELYNFNIKVHEATNNYEYGGCELGGAFGIQTENGTTNASIHDGTVEAYSRTCDGRALRLFCTSNCVVSNVIARGIRHNSSSTGITTAFSARNCTGCTFDSTVTLQADNYIVTGASEDNGFAASDVTYNGTTFRKGNNPAASFFTWRFTNYAQATGTIEKHTCIDCQVANGASLNSVSAQPISYNKAYEVWVKWTYTVNVKVGGVNTSGFTVTLTDGLGNTYTGTTDASGNAAIVVPQYKIYNTSAAAVNTQSYNNYSISAAKTGCTTATASGISVTGTATRNVTTTCP